MATSLLAADDTKKPSVASHPIIPAFERFYSDEDSDAYDGGQLLFGELNCTSCHAIDKSFSGEIIPKQAPILDDVGKRIRVEYLRKFIANPQAVKPGSTMPTLLTGRPADQAKQQVEALVHFLAASGTIVEERVDPQAVGRGGSLFHRVGCVACHAPRQGDQKTLPPHSVPLGDLAAKYTIPSLTQFLQNPHQVRPAGRMPSLNLKGNEAKDIASFLAQGIVFQSKKPNVRFAAFDGSWDDLPDYGKIKPYRTGTTAAFDLTPAGKTSNFGMRFDGFLHVPRDGSYTFHLGSDDASQMFLDGKRVIDNNGIHAHTVKTAATKLTAGAHAIRVDYAQGGGEWTLELHFEGPGVPKQEAYASISPDRNTLPPSKAVKDKKDKNVFVLDPELVKQGRQLFAKIGCASCHEKKENGKRIASSLSSPPFAKLSGGKLVASGGCLAENSNGRTPHFSLSPRQRESLVNTISTLKMKPLEDEERIARTLAAFNCYACHQRNEIGGVERRRNALFLGTIPEMGDEGRIPPHLNGVGDKLRLDWMKQVLDNGADNRPYMHTRMPKFGGANVGVLATAFTKLDVKTEVEIPKPTLPKLRTIATGRFIVGEKALSCIKCHNFGQYKATGIQSIDLQTMTSRLRRDWFHRYMLKPFRYRPGTRMPTGWPSGRSVIPAVLDGDTQQQLVAIWDYLAEGNRAPIPLGLLKQAIVLTPEKEPIIYRNFLEGLSARGIAVGYPEKTHLAFDARNLDLALIWRGAFIDASMHWNGRGQGRQRPLGDLVVPLVRGLPLAVLESGDTPWPNDSAEQLGFRFRGYRFDKQRRPIFRYGSRIVQVEDNPQPVQDDTDTGFKRTLTIETRAPGDNLWYRGAANAKIERLDDDWFLIDDVLKIRVRSGTAKPIIRKVGNQQEMIIPISLNRRPAIIVHEYAW
ncbi:MAG: c-type cytochrome [Planctomycetaceae bacterium]|nr:c-type cytochrome [Planctomycetaceae bacterium]MBT6496006.1 c-type cytochrome [Planctomycetaceae bacterium]